MALKAVYVSDDCAIDYTPGSDVAAGDVIDLGNMVGVAKHPIKSGALGALATEGVFDFVKYTGEEIALFAKVYWDAGTESATATSAYSEADIGLCIKAAAAGDATVRCLLVPRA